MSNDPLTQLGGLAVAAGWVAAVAAPVVVGCGLLARALGRPVVPRWRHRPAVWTGFDVLFLFFLQMLLVGVVLTVLTSGGFFEAVYGSGGIGGAVSDQTVESVAAVGGGAAGEAVRLLSNDALQLRAMWATLFATPLLLLTGAAIRTLVHGRPPRPDPLSLPGDVAFGVLAWAVATPLVFAVYFAALYLTARLGGTVREHPLTQLGTGATVFDQVFFGVVVCFVTPLAEEYLFRGLLVRWAAGRWYRPWVLVGAAALYAVYRGRVGEEPSLAPLWFVAVLGVGLYALVRLGRLKGRCPVRTAAAVYASAALFGAAHSAVWPTPVPLFVLGLALGYVAARTGRIAGCVVLHGLFNAVSFVLLLRGGAG